MEKLKAGTAFRFVPMAFAMALSFCAACSRSDVDAPRVEVADVCYAAAPEANEVKNEASMALDVASAMETDRANAARGFVQQLVRTGSVSLEVRDMDVAQREIGAWAKRFGGYVEESSVETTSGSVTARIPTASFEKAMEEVGAVGDVKSQSLSVEDVSERFYDLRTRLETKRVMRERLTNYLAQAKSVKDMVQIERELNSVVSDLESMERRMKRLSAQISRSTIRVDYRLPYRADPRGGSFKWPDIGDNARRFAVNVVDFLILATEFMLYAVVCGIPVLAVAAFSFWLLFGKVGLLKRIFRRLQ